MAGAGKRDDEDNILAHLLPLTAGAVSPFGFVEEDEEEVNYSETDEDLQSADLPGRGQREASLGGPVQEERSRAGAAPAASERKHEPISWHQWQGPAEHSKKDVATGRGVRPTERDSGSERRRPRDAADGVEESSRDGRARRSRHSPAKSRGRESAREWRDRILREGASERAAAPERHRSWERSRQRSEHRPSQGSEEGEQKTAAPTSSKDAHPEDAACTRVRRRERSDPTLGPPGPLELEETNEEAELRRARKKTSMWDVDAPASASNDDRAGPPEADAGKTRKRSRTPPGPPRLPSPPPAFDHPHSPRRRGRMSVSPPRRRVAISIDNLGPPRRVGRSPPWDPPSGQWQPGPGGQSPPHTWHLEDCGRSPWRHWPPPLRYFGGPPPGRDPLRPDLRDALPLPQPRYPGEWEPGRRSPPLRHLARGPFDRSRSPGRERRVAHSPGWPSRDAPPAHIHPGSLSYRRRSSPPRRSISPAFIDSRLPLRPRRVSVERRGAAEAGAERRQRHIGTSPAARRRSAERKPESRVPASKSSRLQVSSSSKEAAVRERPGEGTAGRSNDGKHGSRAADPPCAEKKEERKDEKASGASGKKRSAEKRAGPEQAARAGLPASAHEIVGEAEDRKGNASEKELKAGGTLAAQSDNKPNSSPAGATQQQKASDAGAATDKAVQQDSAQGPGATRPSDAGEAAPVAPTGMWGPYSATAAVAAADIPGNGDTAQPQGEQASDTAPASGNKGSQPSRMPLESSKAKGSQAGSARDATRGGKDSSRQTAAKASTATNGREQKSSSTKRGREDDAHESRKPEPLKKKRSDARAASRTDRDTARRSSANGNGHAADRNLKRRGAGDTPPPELPLPGPPRLAQSRLDQSAGPSLPAPSKHDEHRMEWLYLDPKGETQGPCSIADFKKWLGALRVQAHMRREYEEFQSCLVWRKDDRDCATRTTLRKLLG